VHRYALAATDAAFFAVLPVPWIAKKFQTRSESTIRDEALVFLKTLTYDEKRYLASVSLGRSVRVGLAELSILDRVISKGVIAFSQNDLDCSLFTGREPYASLLRQYPSLVALDQSRAE